MVAIICIPVNCAIIMFCGDYTYTKEGASSYQKFMVAQDEDYWTYAKIIMFLVLIEHLLLFIKIVIAGLIPDVPRSVIEDEKKRPKILKKALKYLKNIKQEKP